MKLPDHLEIWGLPIVLLIIVIAFTCAGFFLPTTLAAIVAKPSPPTATFTITYAPTSTPIQTNTPTLEPTDTATPTVTPEPPTATPTLTTPTLTITPTPVPDAVVMAPNGLNLRNGPGIAYDPPIGILEAGQFLDIQGRIASGEWMLVSPVDSDLVGWISTASNLVKINLELDAIAMVEAPTPSPASTPMPLSTPVTVVERITVAPVLLDPQNYAGQYKNRIDLEWDWPGTLEPGDYFQVEIWNRYNVCCAFADGDEFANNVDPIDVAWTKNKFYRYDEVEEAFDREFKWRITVVRGTPAGEKQWSTAGNRVWEPSNQSEAITPPSEMRTLFVEPGDEPPPPSDDDNSDGNGSEGTCSRC